MHVAERIYLSMKYGRTVVANFEINLDKIKRSKGNYIYLDNVEITPDRLMQIGSDHVKKIWQTRGQYSFGYRRVSDTFLASGSPAVVLNG